MICLAVDVHVDRVVRVRIEDLIHAHRVLAEVGKRAVHAEIIRLKEPLVHRGVPVTWTARLAEGRCQLELSIEAHLISESVRAQHIVRVD